MYRFRPAKILAVLTFSLMLTAAALGQQKPAGEVVVTKCWAFPTQSTRIATDGSRIFLGSADATVYTGTFDGRKLWSTSLGGEIFSNLLALDSGLFVASKSGTDSSQPRDAVLRALSKETGVTAWTQKLPESAGYSLGGYNGSIIIVARNGIIWSVDAKNGTTLWKREITDGFVAEPVFNGNKVTVASTGKQIFVISMATGEIQSMRKSAFAVTSLDETASGDLVTGDERGNVISYAADREKAVWRFKSGGQISGIAVLGQHLLVTSHDNFVYLLARRTGDVDWKRRLAGRVAGVGGVGREYLLVSGLEEPGAVIADILSGRVAARIAFEEGEALVAGPIAIRDAVVLLTTNGVYAYSLNGCGRTKNGGPSV